MSTTFEIPGLQGLDDFPELTERVRNAVAAAPPGPNGGVLAPPDAIARLKKDLGVDARSAKAVARTVQMPRVGFVPSQKIGDPKTSTDIGAAGKKAQAAARLHKRQADEIEKSIRSVANRAKSARDVRSRARLELDAARLARRLIEHRVKATKASLVAGGTLASLKFRKAAEGERDPNKRNKLLHRATLALDATQRVASTPIRVQIPTAITDAGIEELTRKAEGDATAPVSTAAFGQRPTPPTRLDARTLRMRAASAPSRQNMIPPASPAFATAKIITGGMSPPFAPPVIESNLQGLDAIWTPSMDSQAVGALGDVGDWVNALAGAAKALVPAHTVLGKAINGDIQGAIASGVQWTGNQVAKYVSPAPPQLTPEQQAVQSQIVASTSQVAPPGTSIFNNISPVVLFGVPAAVVVAALLFL